MTVTQAIRQLVRHPIVYLLKQWNWKSAFLSSTFRSALFFFANLSAGVSEARGAMIAEFAYRAGAVGFYAALTEAFRCAEPRWLATLLVVLVLPAAAHSVEFLIHWLRGTPNLAASIGLSIAFSAISTLFTLFAMRKGIMIVGKERLTLLQDLRRLPNLVVEFCALPLSLGCRLLGLRVYRGFSPQRFDRF